MEVLPTLFFSACHKNSLVNFGQDISPSAEIIGTSARNKQVKNCGSGVYIKTAQVDHDQHPGPEEMSCSTRGCSIRDCIEFTIATTCDLYKDDKKKDF